MDDPSGSAVELEMPREWYWWRGYPRIHGHPEYIAETYGPEFYTETAFPSLKPDIDIFGVPRRSRRQRGWHQVAVPFLGRPGEQAGSRAFYRPPAKPSDIPPELFDGILEHLTSWTHRDRPALIRCASVCHYWNGKCQERLFQGPELNSREDALSLLEFMRTPTSAVSSLVRGIRIGEAQVVSGMPWLHLVPVIHDLAHKELHHYSVVLKGPLPAGQRMRSIHYRLPQSLPSHFSRRIFRISLTDVHFKTLDDLMHLVGEMPHLRDLECRRVTWGSLPTALPRRRSRNESLREMDIKMSERGPCQAEASVWLAASVRPRRQGFFSLDDLTHVVSIARGLETTASTGITAYISDSSFWYRHVRFNYKQRDFLSPSREWRIDTITLDIRKPEGSDIVAESEPEWAIVCRALLSFPTLERMVVGFDSREDMLRFEEQVTQLEVHLQRMSSSGMLRYALWDPAGVSRRGNKGAWLRASLESDNTESSGYAEEDLHRVYD